MGVIWLAAAVLALPGWRPIVWLFLGLAFLYYFVVRPYRRRSRFRRSNVAQQDVTLEFADDRLSLGVARVVH